MEDKYVHALAPLFLPQTSIGSVIQQAAFRQRDLLPIYGSSEMLDEVTPYRAFTFFAAYPTGFNVIDIAKSGDTSLDIAQDLAAIGPEMHGKKVVISFTPSMFNSAEVGDKAYVANFSRMHANVIAFSPYLSTAVKHLAARRLLDYPETLSSDPILSFGLTNLAGGTLYNRIMYDFSCPLGQLDILIFRMQDHYAVWSFLQSHPKIHPNPKRQASAIDWNTVIAKARNQQKVNANNNPYGVENSLWINKFHRTFKVNKPNSSDQHYIANLDSSKEWGDLAILLEILKELGAQPVIMSRPINGALYTASGISKTGQQAYYTKLENLVGTYGMPLVDFHQYTTDRFFNIDQASHTSREGWAIVDKRLDAFYHGNIH
jgi:D-alanine transfer protein